jgi:pimeloyl-ACP methyl ester carboxylesterase
VQVKVPCYVLQSSKDLAVPLVVSDYLFHSLGGPTKVEILQTEGHLPQLSCPELLIPVLKRAILD